MKFVAAHTRGEALSRKISFNQLEIRQRGRKAPVCVYPIPQFPNFAVFSEVMEQLGHPIQFDNKS